MAISKEELDLKFSRLRPIKFSDNVSVDSIDDIINELIVNRIPTYHKNGVLQCGRGHRRSIQDTLKVVKYYFPEATTKEILERVFNDKRIVGSYCGDVRKYVMIGFSPNFMYPRHDPDTQTSINGLKIKDLVGLYDIVIV